MKRRHVVGENEWFVNLIGAFAESAFRYVRSRAQALLAKKARLRAMFVVLCIGSAFAFGNNNPAPSPPAANPATGVSGYSWGNTTALLNKVSTTVESKLTALQNNTSLQSVGRLIAGFFLVALLVWTTIKTMTSGKGMGELLGEWVPILVSFGVVQAILDQNVGGMIESFMSSVATAIAGNSMASLDAAILAGVKPIFDAIAAIVEQPRVMEGSTTSEGIMGMLGTMAASAASWIMGVIAKVVAAFTLIVAGVISIAHIIIGFISVRLVLTLAPLMVPFLMFKPLSFLFEGWLRFLLSACMLKVVIAFLLSVVTALITDSMVGLSQQFAAESQQATPYEALQVDILLLGMMMVFALLATLMVAQAPTIAQGLLAGSGAMGFSGLKGITQGTAGRGAQYGAGSAKDFAVGGATKTAQAGARTLGRLDAQANRAARDLGDGKMGTAYSRSYGQAKKAEANIYGAPKAAQNQSAASAVPRLPAPGTSP